MSPAHLIDSRTIKSQYYPEFTAIRKHKGGFIYRDGTVVKTKLRSTNPLGFKLLDFWIDGVEEPFKFSMPVGYRLGTGTSISFRYDEVSKHVVFCNKR
jgi:hypothetical protein